MSSSNSAAAAAAAGDSMDAASSSRRPAKKRRRIVAMIDESSDTDDDDDVVQVFSVHGDTDDDDDDESSVLEPFESLWHDKNTKETQETLLASQASKNRNVETMCTQPQADIKKRPKGTPIPKVIQADATAAAATPESLAMSSISQANTTAVQPEKVNSSKKRPPPRVSLSPTKAETEAKLAPGSKVTMLEAVATGSADAAKSKEAKRKAEKQPSKPVEKKKKKKKDMDDCDPNKSQTKQSKVTKATSKETKKEDSASLQSNQTKSKSSVSSKKEATSVPAAKEGVKVPKESAVSSEKAAPSKVSVAQSSKTTHKSSTSSKTDSLASKSDSKSTAVAGKPAKETTTTSSKPPAKKKRTFQDEVLLHMLLSCKPFTLKSLAQSLNTPEASLSYVLLSLLDKQLVFKKEFASKSGRSKELYWANQDSTAKEVRSLLPSVDEMHAAQEQIKALQKTNGNLAMELNMLEEELGNDELNAQLAELEETVRTAKSRLQESKDRIQHTKATNKPVKKNARENCPRRLKIRINAMRDEWKKRKLKCMDFADQLADGMEKKLKDVVKILELETDEMEGVVMPERHVIEKA